MTGGDAGAFTVAPGEALALRVDLWAFPRGAGLAPSSALGRGVPLDGGAWALQRSWASASRLALAGVSTGAPPSNLSISGVPLGLRPGAWDVAAPTGLIFSSRKLRVTLRGAPLASVLGSNSSLWNGSATVPPLPPATTTTFVIAAGSSTIIVPAWTLQPGFLYTADARADLFAAWSFASSSTLAQPIEPWAPWIPSTQEVPPFDTATGSLFDPADTFTTTVCALFAPLLFAHVPPVGGVISVNASGGGGDRGTLFIDTFKIITSGWQAPDALALAQRASSLGVSAAAVLSAFPAPPAAAAALVFGRTDVFPVDASGAAAAAAAACSYPIDGSFPAWARAWTSLAAPLGLYGATACSYALFGTSQLSGATDASDLVFLFRSFRDRVVNTATSIFSPVAQVSSWWTFGGGAPAAASIISSQPLLKSLLDAPPGVALSSMSSLTFVASSLAMPNDTFTTSSNVTILVLAVDGYGGVGAAFAGVIVAAPFTKTTIKDTNIVSGFVDTVITTSLTAGTDSSGAWCNPEGAIATVGSLASLLSSTTSTSAAPSQNAVSSNTRLVNSFVGSLSSLGTPLTTECVSTVSAIAGVPAPSSVQQNSNTRNIDNSMLLVAGSALTALTSAPTIMGPSAAVATRDATRTLLLLAAAVGSSPFPAAAPSLFLGVVSSAVSAAGGFANLSGAACIGASAAPTTGLDAAARTSASDTLSALTAAALRGVLPGSPPFVISSAPSSNSTYCGPAIAIAIARIALPVGSGSGVSPTSLAIVPPMPRCETWGTNQSYKMTLPASIVAAQPPPSLDLDGKLLSALARPGGPVARALRATDGGGANVDIQLVLWGWSPVPETAGLSRLTYAAPSGGSRIANARARRAGDISSAASAAIDSAVPLAKTVVDTVPNHALDSRVVALSLFESKSGAAIALPEGAVNASVSPFVVTVPLRDLTAVIWSPDGDVGHHIDAESLAAPTYFVVCPASVNDLRATGGRVRWTSRGGAPGARGVTLLNATLITFSADQRVSSATPVDLAAVGSSLSANGGGSTAADAIGSIQNVQTAAVSVFLSAMCADANVTFLCVGTTSNVTMACPAIAPTPQCMWFDDSSGQWSAAGCTVLSRDLTSVTCACDRGGLVAARFAGLKTPSPDTFVAPQPVLHLPVPTPPATLLIAAASAALLLGFLGATWGSIRDKKDELIFSDALRKDAEIAFVSRAHAAHSRTTASIVDRCDPDGSDARAAAIVPRPRTAKVAPLPVRRAADALDGAARPTLDTLVANAHSNSEENSTARLPSHGPADSKDPLTAAAWLRTVQLLEHVSASPASAASIDAVYAGFGETPAQGPNVLAEELLEFDVALRHFLLTRAPTAEADGAAETKGTWDHLANLLEDAEASTVDSDFGTDVPTAAISVRAAVANASPAPSRRDHSTVAIAQTPSTRAALAIVGALRTDPRQKQLVERTINLLRSGPGSRSGATVAATTAARASFDCDDVASTEAVEDTETFRERFARLSAVAFRLALVRALRLSTACGGPVLLYHPTQPRAVRVAGSISSLLVASFIIAYIYANVLSSPGAGGRVAGDTTLEPLSTRGVASLVFIGLFVGGAWAAFLTRLLRKGSEAEFLWRRPLIAAEISARAEIEASASNASTRTSDFLSHLRAVRGAPVPDLLKGVSPSRPQSGSASIDPSAPSSHAASRRASTDATSAPVVPVRASADAAVVELGADAARDFTNGAIEWERTATLPRFCSLDACRYHRKVAPLPAAPRANRDSVDGSFGEQGSDDEAHSDAVKDALTHPPLLKEGPPSRLGCTASLGSALALAWVSAVFSWGYLCLFGFLRGPSAGTTMLLSAILALLLLQTCAVLADIAGITISWIVAAAHPPIFGGIFGSAHAADARGTGENPVPLGLLTARLRIFAVVRAAAKAARLPPDTALALYADPGALSAVFDARVFSALERAARSPRALEVAALRASAMKRHYTVLLLGLGPNALHAAAAHAIAARIAAARVAEASREAEKLRVRDLARESRLADADAPFVSVPRALPFTDTSVGSAQFLDPASGDSSHAPPAAPQVVQPAPAPIIKSLPSAPLTIAAAPQLSALLNSSRTLDSAPSSALSAAGASVLSSSPLSPRLSSPINSSRLLHASRFSARFAVPEFDTLEDPPVRAVARMSRKSADGTAANKAPPQTIGAAPDSDSDDTVTRGPRGLNVGARSDEPASRGSAMWAAVPKLVRARSVFVGLPPRDNAVNDVAPTNAWVRTIAVARASSVGTAASHDPRPLSRAPLAAAQTLLRGRLPRFGASSTADFLATPLPVEGTLNARGKVITATLPKSTESAPAAAILASPTSGGGSTNASGKIVTASLPKVEASLAAVSEVAMNARGKLISASLPKRTEML